MPNETWQSDFTHYRLTRPDGRPGADVEIITWLDDCTRYALHVTAHARITTPIVLTTFREAAGPARDPGIHAHRQRHGLHRPTGRPRPPRRQELLRSRTPPPPHRPEELPTRPPHHLRQGRAVPADDEEVAARPTRSSRARSPSSRHSSTSSPTSTTTGDRTARCPTGPPRRPLYDSMPKALPGPTTDPDTHDRIRHDRVDKAGSVTLRTTADCTTSASAEPTPEPASSCSSRTSTSASSTPPPANSSANSSSTPHRDYQPTGAPKGPTRDPRNEQHPDLQSQVRAVADVLRHHIGSGGRI